MKIKNSEVTITWYGHSAFLLESPKGKRVLIDPWLDNPNAPSDAKEIDGVDIILITHGHSDHIGNSLEIAQRTNAAVISIFEVYLHLIKEGISTARGMNKGGTVTIDDIVITMVDARHSSGIDRGSDVAVGGEAAGYIVGFENGFKVYHAGDTALFGDMKLIGGFYKPDAAVVPIGGLYTMDPRDAAYACQLINPKYIIGMHYGTFPVLAGTPSELKRHLPPGMKKKVIEMEPGERFTF